MACAALSAQYARPAPHLCLDLRQEVAHGRLAHAVHVPGLAALKPRFSTLPRRGVAFLVVCDAEELAQVAHAFLPRERWAIVGIVGVAASDAVPDDALPDAPHPCTTLSHAAFQGWAEAHGVWSRDAAPHLLFSPAPVVARVLGLWDDAPQHAAILDVGCGAGRDVVYLLVAGRRRQAAWRATLLDRWRAALRRAELLLADHALLQGPGAYAEALLPTAVLNTGALQLDGCTTAWQDAPLPCATYDLILLIRFWPRPLLDALPSRTALGTLVVLSHFVHAPPKLGLPGACAASYATPPPAARIQPGEVDALVSRWNVHQRWEFVDNRVEPIEDGRPVQSVVLRRVA